ncbi:MAG: transglycosylase domain-containing protein [Actinomycetota bacterium]
MCTALISLLFVATSCGELEQLTTEKALERLTVATSKVYDARGNVIANLHGEINRDSTKLDQVPKHVRDAAVAIEDERFWDHQGVDARSIIRAAVRNTRSDESGSIQGGSTISQQLAKNLYFTCSRSDPDCVDPRPARTVTRKIAEARVSWQLERQYSKSEILEMYLNTIYFGRGRYGVETAARSYFGKSTGDLTVAEGAFLMGLIHEPARYEWTESDPPERRDERVARGRNRRDHVIDRMHKLKMISADRADAAKDAPLAVRPPDQPRWQHPYFVDLALRQLGVFDTSPMDPRYDFLGVDAEERSANVYRRGLRIYTTLDPDAQEAAEKAIEGVLPEDISKMFASLVSIEPRNGYIRALVGGRDYYPDCERSEGPVTPECRIGKLNLALGEFGGGSGRQPGSSFKPIALAAALESGIPLYQTYDGSPFTHPIPFSEAWSVSNYDGAGTGPTTLIEGTKRSVNAVFAHLAIDGLGEGEALKGAARIAETARRLGIGFPTPKQLEARCDENFMKIDKCIPADSVPATSLGAKEISLIDQATAYATFANDGVRMEPTAIARIEDADGRVLYRADPTSTRAIPAASARGVTYALQQVIAGGTGTRAAIDRPAAGKTGTSQSWRDAWFAGYVPQLATAVWVGNPISTATGPESMTPANGYPIRVVGGSYPAMIWHDYMTEAMDGIPVVQFAQPPQILFRGSGAIIQPSPSPSGSSDPFASDVPAGSVPSVIGYGFGEAGSAVRAAGFKANTVRGCDPSGSSELHQVFSQSPEAGTEAPQGSAVTILYQGGGCD